MKRFLRYTGLFTALVGVGFIGFIALIILTRFDLNYSIPEDVSIIVAGDSHPECAINDKLLQKVLNVGSSGEATFYSCEKCVNIIRKNRNVNYLFFSIWPAKFNNDSDDSIGDFFWSYYYSKNVQHLMPAYLFNSIKSLSDRDRILRLLLKHPKITMQSGGYLFLDRDKLTVDIHRHDSIRTNSTNNPPPKGNTATLSLFRELEQECNKNGVKLCFIVTPMYQAHRWYPVDEFRKMYREEFPDVPMYDFLDYPLADSCYGDIGHLNYKGARIFSEMLRDSVFSKLPPVD